MAGLTGLSFLRKVSRCTPLIIKPQLRCISTSKKNRDTATVTSDVRDSTVCDVNTKKNWMSYGFSETSEKEDRAFMHITLFLGVTLVFCCGGFVLMYRPDDVGRDWAQREAFLELRRREQLGLPPIDPNYLPVSKIILPTDEELGDTEIVV